VEAQSKRLAGGVSTSINNVELGVGALYADESPGVTGYAAYSVGLLRGRLELNWQESTGVNAGLALGFAAEKNGLSFEPFISLPITDSESHSIGVGVKLGLQFGKQTERNEEE